jgi:RNA polymerase sigma factor (sigma-70 family)
VTADASDEALYAAWCRGDAAAGNELAARYGGQLARFFGNKVPDVAEDLTQRTFLACMTGTPELRHSFRALLFGIARKQLLQHFEGRGALRGEEMMSELSIADLQTTPTQRIARDQESDLLHRALAMLPVDAQIALELRYWRKMSADEIAEILGLSSAGARTRVHRARALLRERFEALSQGRPMPEFVES